MKKNQQINIELTDKSEKAFLILCSIFIASLLLTNLIGGKFFIIKGLPISCSVITYPITFLVTDIVSEIYGLHYSKILVWTGFVVSIFITLIAAIANKIPTSPHSPIDSSSFEQVFGLMPGFVFGSMAAYLFSQFIDVHIFELLRKGPLQKHLWIRNNGSTITSQLIDTITSVTISLVIWPILHPNTQLKPIDFNAWKTIVIGQYSIKALFALLDTPIIYLAVKSLKAWLNIHPSK